MATISACLIVKNEEDNLSRCLKSIKKKVDEIIIVDTGSTDSTKKIANQFTGKIYDFKWEQKDGLGDFSKARNYSISKATKDYIFWIDADEELLDLDHSFRSLADGTTESIMFRQAQCVPKEDHEFNTDEMHDRMFKRGKIQFVGIVHEYPSADGINFLNSKMQTNCSILHYGLANLRVKAVKSLQRNNPLIIKNLGLNPNNPMAHYHHLTTFWSNYVFDLDNEVYVKEAFDKWDNVLKPMGNIIVDRMAILVLQRFMKMKPSEYQCHNLVFGRTIQEAKSFYLKLLPAENLLNDYLIR